jgi:hypothetical protein
MLLVACGVLTPMSAKALPFEATPEGFQNYLNSGRVNWDDNSNNFFYNPRHCKFREPSSVSSSSYSCVMDFEITTSLGTKTCINYVVFTGGIYGNKVLKEANRQYSPECGKWERVSTAPEPREPLSSPATPETPNTEFKNITLNQPNDIMPIGIEVFRGGVVGFLLGGGFVLMLNKLIPRK